MKRYNLYFLFLFILSFVLLLFKHFYFINSLFLSLFIFIIYIFAFWIRRYNILYYILFFFLFIPFFNFLLSGFGLDKLYSFTNGLSESQNSVSALIIYISGVFSFFLPLTKYLKSEKIVLRNIKICNQNSLFVLYSLIFSISFISILFILIENGSIPLFSIHNRWESNTKVLFLVSVGYIICPLLLYYSYDRYKLIISIFIIVFLLCTSLQGSRLLPAKICLALYFFTIISNHSIKKRNVFVFGFLLVSLFVFVGVFSKSSIYNTSYNLILPLAILFSDVAGTYNNFEKIVEKSHFFLGYYSDLTMYFSSISKMIPGSDSFYSNFHITKIITGSFYNLKNIDGNMVYAPMSFSPTFFGVAFGSLGYLFMVLESFCMGLLFRILLDLSKISTLARSFLPSFSVLICYSCYAGYYLHDSLYLIFTVLLVILSILLNKLFIKKISYL